MEWPPARAERRGSSRARRDSSPILENVVHYSKRKADGAHVASQKRRRLDLPTSLLPSVAGLPCQVWQRVFLYLDPVTLGRLLRVNRAFCTLLTSVDEPSSGSQHLSTLPVVTSNFIWLSARKAYFPTFPRPLMDMSELAMWRLLGSRRCQFCAKTSRPDQTFAFKSAFEDGPGSDGVRIVWPFGVRTCGRCLEAHSQTEQTLLFAVNSALLAALPYVFVTQNLHVVPATVISSTSTIPANIKISKWYWREHVRDIQLQSEETRSLGPAAGEEWLKGLEHAGKQRLMDAERWERWERTRGMQESDAGYSKSILPAQPPGNGQRSQPSPYQMPRQLPMNGVPRAGVAAQYSQQYSGPSTDRHVSPKYAPTNVAQRLRPERNIRDANEAKAVRKSEIERRCQEFDPPLLPSVLRHMKAFQAACQISAPLTEKAWEMLKPRLEAERKAAEDVEHERAAQMATLQVKLEDRRHQDASLKEVREVLEREWEEVQRPVRERLGAYADETIQRDWAEGRSLTKENCPNFAAKLLMEVRQRFYDEQTREDEVALAAGQEIKEDPPTGPPTRRLILENMKWVFDNKIKPRTEQFRKEIFLCCGDGCEGNSKWYGFEGIIQHFGAKHTTAFSVGNVVVCWKEADWPEEPPFHPDPARARQGFYDSLSVPGPAHSLPHQYPYPYPGYAPAPAGLPPMAHTPHPIPQHSPVPFGQYGYPSGPFPPPQAPLAPLYGPQVPQSHPFVPPPGPIPAYTGPPQAPWQEGRYSHDVSQQYPDPADSPPGAAFATPNGPAQYSDSDALRHGASPAVVPGSYGQFNGTSPYNILTTSMAIPGGASAPKIYQDQIQALIDVARDLWTSTSGIKHLNQTLRLSVVVYHIIYHFNLRFGVEPSLDLLADALDAHQSMYPINAVAGLRCKACAMGLQKYAPHLPSSSSSSSSSSSYPSHGPERNFPDLLSLILHFKSEHMGGIASSSREQSPGSRYDWKRDMIDIPEEGSISALIQSPGMDDHKLRIIAEAFPKLFPSPLPHIGVVTEDENEEAICSAENSSDPPRPLALLDDRASSRHDHLQGSHSRSAPARRQDIGKSPTSRSSAIAPRPVLRGALKPYIGHPQPSEPRSVSRMSRRYDQTDQGSEDWRTRVYYDEPGYHVSRDLRDLQERDYNGAWRDPYDPLSPAAVRRYSHYGRIYDSEWEGPPPLDRYYLEPEDLRTRSPTRSGIRYLERLEYSAEPPARRHESRPRDLEEFNSHSIARELTARASAAPDVAADADRFLDDLGRDRTREYVSRAARDEAQEAAEDRIHQSSRPPDEPPVAAAGNPGGDAPSENARNATESQNGRANLESKPPSARIQAPAERYHRGEEYRPSPRYEPEPRGHAYGPSRYRRYSMHYEEPQHERQRFVRARGSRFSRYEATRRRLEQSKSPTREGTAQPERRPGSPSVPPPPIDKRGGESQQTAPAPPRDYYYPYDECDSYARQPPSPLVDFRYTGITPARRSARPGPTYFNEYGELVEYVRVHDPYYAERRRQYVPEAPATRSAAPMHRANGDPRLARYYEYADQDMRDPRDRRGETSRFDYHGAVADDDVRYAYYQRERQYRDYRDRDAYYPRDRDVDVRPTPRARESIAERDLDRERNRGNDFYSYSGGPPEAAVPPADSQREREDRRGSFAGPPPPPLVDEREETVVAGRERGDGGEE